jgi:AraC-like DNA-binding protein
MISLRYFAPAEPLRELISSYYLFEVEADHVSDLLRAELAQMRFVLRGSVASLMSNGRTVTCPRAMINGPTTGSVIFQGQGPLTIVGVGLMPMGWASLIGCGADELADDIVRLDDALGAAATNLLDRLLNARGAAAIVTALDATFLALAERSRSAPRWFARAADDWLMSSPAPKVDALLETTGVSARHIERLAKRMYGASPKLLARKYRALQAAVRIGTGEAKSWMDAAGDAFYDQPHFIREFKQFVGMTPHRFAIEGAPVMRLTIQGRRKLATLPKLALYS